MDKKIELSQTFMASLPKMCKAMSRAFAPKLAAANPVVCFTLSAALLHEMEANSN